MKSQDQESYNEVPGPRTLLREPRSQEPMGTQAPIERTQDPGLYENPGPRIRTSKAIQFLETFVIFVSSVLLTAVGVQSAMYNNFMQIFTFLQHPPGIYLSSCFRMLWIMKVFFFCTTDLHNTKIKSKLNNRALPDIWRSDTGNGKIIKKKHPCMHKYCLQSFLAEMKHLVKKYLATYVC